MKYYYSFFSLSLLMLFGCAETNDLTKKVAIERIAKIEPIEVCREQKTNKLDDPKYNVFGLYLGEHFSLKECENSYYGGNDHVCFQTISRNINNSESICNQINNGIIQFPIDKSPSILGTVSGLVVSGRLEEIVIETAGYSIQDYDLEKLKVKYGKPTALLPQKMQNSLGATYNTFIALWDLGDINISFSSVMGKIDTGQISINTKIGRNARSKLFDDAQKNRTPL